MILLAIDPGTTESGWVLFDGTKVIDSGVLSNHLICIRLSRTHSIEPQWAATPDQLAIEMIASYGMPVGAEVFETCVWIGRFIEAWNGLEDHRLIYRRDVKLELCGSPRAKDANIRQALIDRIGAPGTKKEPGPTYGVKSHAWAALGVAVTAFAKEAA
jgi:hypothetical protein